MLEWFLWAKGYGVPTILGIAAFVAAVAARIYLAPYLPKVSGMIATLLTILGAGLIGYAQGFDTASEAARQRDLVEQAEAMQRTIKRMGEATAAAHGLQEKMAATAVQMQTAAQEQKGQANDLIEQLKAMPAPAGCEYTPDERQRMRAIKIHRPRPAAGADPGTR